MSRFLALAAVSASLLGAGLAGPTPAAAEDEGVVYQRYADIRERLYSCFHQAILETQSAEDRADCRRLQRPYVLYAWTGEGYLYHVHCRSPRRCIPTPSGEPRADGPIPAGATVYDVRVTQKTSRRKRKRRCRKSRTRRGRAKHRAHSRCGRRRDRARPSRRDRVESGRQAHR